MLYSKNVILATINKDMVNDSVCLHEQFKLWKWSVDAGNMLIYQ